MIGAPGAPEAADRLPAGAPRGMVARGAVRARATPRRAAWAVAGAGAATVVGLSVVAWAAFLRGRAPAIAWDTQSFTEYAALLARGQLPPVGLRLPGYPIFLLLAGGRGIDLHRVVAAQILLWVAANAMVFEVVRRLTRSALAGLAAALVVLTFADLLFLAITAYSELLCLFLVDAAALATAASFQTRRRPWILAAAGLWTSAALVRPVFLVGAAGFAAFAVIAALVGRLDRRAVAIACGGVAGVVLSVATVNWARCGQLQFALGSGLSLLNYVGHPDVYRNLPPDQAPVRELFQRLAREGGAEWVAWWTSVGPLAHQAGTPSDGAACDRVARAAGSSRDLARCDRVVRGAALRAIGGAPAGYLGIWRGVSHAFLTDVDLFYGWYERPGAPAPQWSAGSWQHRAALGATAFWRERLGVVSYGALLLPLAALALLAAARRRPGAASPGTALALAALWAILSVLVLTSTAIEPWPGQMRYRYPLQHLQVVVAVAAAILIGRALRSLSSTGQPGLWRPGGLSAGAPRADRGSSRRRLPAGEERGWS